MRRGTPTKSRRSHWPSSRIGGYRVDSTTTTLVENTLLLLQRDDGIDPHRPARRNAATATTVKRGFLNTARQADRSPDNIEPSAGSEARLYSVLKATDGDTPAARFAGIIIVTNATDASVTATAA